jgi:hypothetical protein
MKKPTPEERERWRRLDEEAEAALARAQEIFDRVAARRREREERAERRRRRWRRFFPFRPAA